MPTFTVSLQTKIFATSGESTSLTINAPTLYDAVRQSLPQFGGELSEKTQIRIAPSHKDGTRAFWTLSGRFAIDEYYITAKAA